MLARVRQAVSSTLEGVCVTGAGCDACTGHGTVGRTVVAEIIIPDDRFFRLVRQGEKTEALAYWMGELGGRPCWNTPSEKSPPANWIRAWPRRWSATWSWSAAAPSHS